MAKKKASGYLTPKQEAFAYAYIETGNASEAYRRSYNVSPNAKPNTVEKRACELLKNGKVAGRVAQLKAELKERHEVTIDRVVQELALLGFSNMLDYVRTTSDGDAYVDLSDLTREQAAAISEVVVEEYTEGRGEDSRNVKRTKFKLSDKRSALVELGKHLGMFKADKELTLTHTVSKELKDLLAQNDGRTRGLPFANGHAEAVRPRMAS